MDRDQKRANDRTLTAVGPFVVSLLFLITVWEAPDSNWRSGAIITAAACLALSALVWGAFAVHARRGY